MIRLGPGAEFDLIRRLLIDPPGAFEGVSVGPGDDAAVLQVEGSVVLSADLTIEGVHFQRRWLTLPEIGYRAVATAMSDLAAMAARPVGVLVSLGLPAAEAAESGPALQDGIRDACVLCEAALLGGDVTSSPGPLVLDVMVVGSVDQPTTRDGARPGDELWVTGVLGGAAAAVTSWEAGGDPDPAAVEFDDGLGDGEAQPGALGLQGVLNALEALEEPREVLGGDADAGVDHPRLDRAALAGLLGVWRRP